MYMQIVQCCLGVHTNTKLDQLIYFKGAEQVQFFLALLEFLVFGALDHYYLLIFNLKGASCSKLHGTHFILEVLWAEIFLMKSHMLKANMSWGKVDVKCSQVTCISRIFPCNK